MMNVSKKERFSIEEVKEMDTVDYLSRLGFKPAKIRSVDYWYLSPLISSLQDLLKDRALISPFVGQKVFQFFRENMQTNDDYKLSSRETEILEHLVKDLSYKMVAGGCDISIDTGRKHLQNIYHKLQVHSGSEAVRLAIKEKIVRL